MPLNARVASQTARVLVVDDHAAVRSGVEAVLEGEPDLEPVGAVGRAAEALALARQTRPDVAIVDIQLAEGNGLSLCLELKELPHPVRVVLYSAYADGPLALAGVIAGADGVLHKASLATELCETVRAVANGRAVLPPVPHAAQAMVAARLAPEDMPILAMMVAGTAPDDIAKVMQLRPEELVARRWAMVKRLSRMSTRGDGRGAAGHPEWPPGALHA